MAAKTLTLALGLVLAASAAQAAQFTVQSIAPNGSLTTLQPCVRLDASTHYNALTACLKKFSTIVQPGQIAMRTYQTPAASWKVVKVGATDPRWGERVS
jgi:hypothetical protein